MQNEIKSIIQESVETNKLVHELAPKIEEAANLIIYALQNNKKILIAGNGGSCSQASHIAGEFVGRFKIERKGLPCIALTADTSILTALSNDYGFETIFERQLEAYAHPGDVFIALSTSGNSKNLIKAVEAAKKNNIHTIGLLGKDGGKMKNLLASMLTSSHATTSSVEIIVNSDNTPRIQEAHLLILHIICELIDKEMFGK